MKFTAPIPALAAALRHCASIADPKSLPLLKHACLRVRGSTLTVAATDLNVTVIAELAVTGAKDGALALDAKSLSAIVGKLPGDTVDFIGETNNWATVKAKRVSNRLVGCDVRDFPKLPDRSEVEFRDVDATVLRSMIEHTLFSVCNDETRFHLNGVLFECDGAKARMVSTDGHRLSKVDRALGGPETKGVIVPKKGVERLKSLLTGPTARLGIRGNYMFLSVENTAIACKLIDGQFPPYAQVIPSESTRVATVDRVTLLEAVKRSALMSSETRGLKLSFADGAITLKSDDPDRGDSTEEIDAEYTGDALTIGVNPKYLLDVLGATEADAVTLGMGTALDPMLVQPVGGDAFSGVIMPVRVT